MRNLAFTVFKISLGLIFFAKLLNWILHFSDQVNMILNTAMFCLIGIAYIVMATAWNNKFIRTIFLACGVFLIVMNFLGQNVFFNILGIASILTPMLIGRFYKEKTVDADPLKA
jgi:hypothetical protein